MISYTIFFKYDTETHSLLLSPEKPKITSLAFGYNIDLIISFSMLYIHTLLSWYDFLISNFKKISQQHTHTHTDIFLN